MIETEVTISEDGSRCTELVVNPLEDLWHDYIHFFQQAENESAEEPAFMQKRYLRAALIVFTAYCNGVVDQWCQAERQKETIGPEETEEWLRRNCLDKKCQYLKKRANVTTPTPCLKFKQIRNRLVHPQQRGEQNAFYSLKDFHALTPKLVGQATRKMVGWLDRVGTALGYRRHVDSDTLMTKREGLTSSLSTKPNNATPLPRDR
jgi:hypothetical protein